MSLKEKLSHFWNETLGVDCPEEIDISDSQNPEIKESLARVGNLEKKYQASSTSNKGGKGNSGKGIVKQVEVNSVKAMKQAKQKVAESKGKTGEEKQI